MLLSQSDRRKAQVAMETSWKSMEKKEKIPWIKKAAEDQKRYERELLEMRGPVAAVPTAPNQRKPKFNGEPKRPPVSGYQMFSQELLTNGELNHFSLKERMVEIGKRWQRLSQSQKDQYKRQVEQQQSEYRHLLEAWVKSLSPQDRAVYLSSTKRRSTTKVRTPVAKVRVTAKTKPTGKTAVPDKRSMAYRAKQDVSDSDSDHSDSSDSDEDDETSSDSDDENEDDDDEDDEEPSSSEESDQSESD